MVNLISTTFSQNKNSRGAAIYFDGHNNFVSILTNITNVTFEQNEAKYHGGAIYFGPSIWEINGVFSELNCSQNKAEKSLHFFFFNLF